MLYKFKLDYNALEATKIIFCMKGESTVDHSTVTRSFKKFCSGYKNIDDQAMLGSSKTEFWGHAPSHRY